MAVVREAFSLQLHSFFITVGFGYNKTELGGGGNEVRKCLYSASSSLKVSQDVLFE